MEKGIISQEAVDAYNALHKGYPNNIDQLHGILLMEILLRLQEITENPKKD